MASERDTQICDKPVQPCVLREDLDGNPVYPVKGRCFYEEDIVNLVKRMAVVWPIKAFETYSPTAARKHYLHENRRLCLLSSNTNLEEYLYSYEFPLWRFYSYIRQKNNQTVTFPKKRFVRDVRFTFNLINDKVRISDTEVPNTSLVNFLKPQKRKRRKLDQPPIPTFNPRFNEVIDMAQHRCHVKWDLTPNLDQALSPEGADPSDPYIVIS